MKTQVKQFDFKGNRNARSSYWGTAPLAGSMASRKTRKYIIRSHRSPIPPPFSGTTSLSGKSELHEKPKVDFNLEDYETKQVFYESKDGTKIPMRSLFTKRASSLNGKNPTWLYAYGG